LHAGEAVLSGIKHIARTDVLFRRVIEREENSKQTNMHSEEEKKSSFSHSDEEQVRLLYRQAAQAEVLGKKHKVLFCFGFVL
jgi:hypothetical protein